MKRHPKRPRKTPLLAALTAVGLLAGLSALPAQDQHLWQTQQAKVLPNGDLEYTPKSFEFVAGDSVRYIDFEGGDDSNSGESKDAAWKHHPWDPDAGGNAKSAASGPHTYVFKGGVTYRGQLIIPEDAAGTAENPIRLTTDPSWGNGRGIINGAELVTGWKKEAHDKMPDGQKVWAAEVDFLPRTLWLTSTNGEPERLKIARYPNWEEAELPDVMAEWPTWDQPQWWKDINKVKTKKRGEQHLGVDKDLPQPLKDLEGGVVWTEWGIVMGSPYPAEIVEVFPEKNGIAFRGPWTWNRTEKIITGNRYYLENLPQFLDEGGEYWVEKTGGNKGKIYLRLPNDSDPNNATIEAGRFVDLVKGSKFQHIHFTGLQFRFTNVGWNYMDPQWAHEDLQAGAIHLTGEGDGIVIAHNVFEHVNMPVRIDVGSVQQQIGRVEVSDNLMQHTDHGAITIGGATVKEPGVPISSLEYVGVFRNKLYEIGMRNLSGAHGHAVDVRWARTSDMAGNFLNRIAGWGLAVFGGKPSGQEGYEVPLSRHLVWHNRVEDVLLKSNDWGGIETWQGGSHYVFDNVVINALGFKNWTFRPDDPDNIGGFGHAYYMDGSFKNYMFNNIGLGTNNELGTKGVNASAIQNIISFENWYFNNSMHKFAEMTRQQAGDIGRRRYLGNVFSDVSRFVFRHANPKDVAPDPNASHYSQASDFHYNTLAYSQNVLWDITGRIGTFEETGAVYDEMDGFAEALEKLNAQAASVGVLADQQPLVAPEEMKWSPAAGTATLKQNVLVFVPWAVSRTVGEWQFTLNQANPAEVIDEHWFMTAEYDDRGKFKDTRRYPLIGQNISADDYTDGPLANWTRSALAVDGENRYLSIANDTLPAPAGDGGETAKPTADQGNTATTKVEIGEITHPKSVTPGESFDVVVKLDKAYPGQQVDLHVHWMKGDGWGGFAGLGGKAQSAGENTYKFSGVKATDHSGLASYNLVVFLSPDGSFANKTAEATARLAVGEPLQVVDAQPRSVNVDDTSFMVEAHLKTSDSDGIIVSKMAGETGYKLEIAGGKPQFTVATGGATATVTADSAISDGQFHHVLAELDRANGKLNLYLDGKLAASESAAIKGSLANSSDFYVAGGPDLPALAATLDFLRVSLSTLEESRTTIEELYAWQFDGPQYRDFAGNNRRQQNAAGALVK